MFYIAIAVLVLVLVVVYFRDWFKSFIKTEKTEKTEKLITYPMVYAINDDGNFDLMDASGKILNIGFGPNPKVYINLLDQAEKDVQKTDSGFHCNIDTKSYQVSGNEYVVNFTRLRV